MCSGMQCIEYSVIKCIYVYCNAMYLCIMKFSAFMHGEIQCIYVQRNVLHHANHHKRDLFSIILHTYTAKCRPCA